MKQETNKLDGLSREIVANSVRCYIHALANDNGVYSRSHIVMHSLLRDMTEEERTEFHNQVSEKLKGA